MATHSSIIAWKFPWTEEPGGQRSPWGCKELDTTEHTHKNTCLKNERRDGLCPLCLETKVEESSFLILLLICGLNQRGLSIPWVLEIRSIFMGWSFKNFVHRALRQLPKRNPKHEQRQHCWNQWMTSQEDYSGQNSFVCTPSGEEVDLMSLTTIHRKPLAWG